MTLIHGGFPGYKAYWGAPVEGKNGGVGFLVKSSAAWHTTPVTWDKHSPCYIHHAAGRLHAVKVFTGDGSSHFLIYVLYGVSGARWNIEMKTETHRLIEDVCADIACKGLPAIFGGDLNLQLNESPLLERLPQLNFTNLAIFSSKAHEATCFKGKKGSTIDHVFVNQLMMATFSSFQVGSHSGLADHAPLFCQFQDMVKPQFVLRNRSCGDSPTGILQKFTPNTDITLPDKFHIFLRKHDVDSAFRCWCHYAECHLQTMWHALDEDASFAKGRGAIRLDPQRVWPHVRGDGTASLKIRRMWKHCCRMIQIKKQPFGQQAKNTWKNTRDVLSILNQEEADFAAPFLFGTCCQESATKLLECFNNALERIQKEEKTQRITNWKAKLQHSLRAQHTWLKQDTNQQQNLCFQDKDGHYTANIQDQFDAVRNAWSAVTNLFQHGEPSHEQFFQSYNDYIPYSPYQACVITPTIFRQTILSTTESSPGLDQWTFKDLKLLATYTPFVFDSFVKILHSSEQNGRWPQPLISGYCSLIPKSSEPPDNPLQLRPIIVLSSLYRIWAKIRAQEIANHWQETWIHTGARGGRIRQGAETVIFEVMADLEKATATHFCGGLSFDLVKAFDKVPRGLLSKILSRIGLPDTIHKPYVGMLTHATRRYKLKTYFDQACPIYGGILQGCPLSMICMNVITNIELHNAATITWFELALDFHACTHCPLHLPDQTSDQLTIYSIASFFMRASKRMAAICKNKMCPAELLEHCDSLTALGFQRMTGFSQRPRLKVPRLCTSPAS